MQRPRAADLPAGSYQAVTLSGTPTGADGELRLRTLYVLALE